MATPEIGIRLTLQGNQQVDAGLQRTARQLDAFGMSSAQTAAAMRMVPAQMTDIVTSLQAGQNPLTVLLQQGGQLKDMFGGIAPAAKALGGYIVGLINPYTLAAAAVATLGLAYYQGSAEADRFRKALTMTGNLAGTSADQMAAMAQSMREVGMTAGQAAEIMGQFAATGRVAAADLQQFTAVAAAMEKLLGVPVEQTVKAFVELGKSPVEAARKLNEEQHYLTAAVYEQIQTLEAEGRALEAGQLAQRSYNTAMQERTENIRQSLGSLERAWGAVGGFAKAAWDRMLDIGRADSLEEKLADAQERLQRMSAFGARNMAPITASNLAAQQAQVDTLKETIRLRDRSAAQQRDQRTAEDAAIKALDAVGKLQDKGLSKQEQLAKALKDYRANLDRIRAVNPGSSALGAEQIAAGEAALREMYKESEKAKDGTYDRLIARIQDFAAAQRAELQVSKELTAGEKLAVDVKAALERAGSKLSAQQRQRIEIDSQAALALEKQALAQRAAAKAAEEHAQALERTQARADGLRRSMADSAASQAEQYDDRLGVIGLGSQAAERLASRIKIEREYARYQRQLTEEAARNKTLESDAYKLGMADIEASLQRALAANERYYGRVDELRSNSMLGLSQAVADYSDNAVNLFAQTETLTSNALRGMEDALVRFVQTGKLSFSDLANSIIADLTRMIVKQAIFNAIAGFMSAAGGSMYSLSSGAPASATGLTLGGGEGLTLGGGTGLSYGGFRAAGGSVASGGLYQVAEQGPELLHTAGKTYLMMGSQGGSVAPATASTGSPKVSVVVNNYAGNDTRATASTGTDAMGGTVIELMVEKVEAGLMNRVNRGTGMAPLLERRYGLSPAMGAMR